MKRIALCSFVLLICFTLASPAAWSAPRTSSPAASLIAADPGNNFLVTSPRGLSVDVYEPASQKLLYSIRFGEFVPDFSGIGALAVDETNLMAACAVTKKKSPGVIYLFDLRAAKLRGVISGLPADARLIGFSGNGRYLAVGTADHQGLLIYKIIQIRKAGSSSAASLSDEEKAGLSKLGYLEKQMLSPDLVLQDKDIQGEITALSFDNRENLVMATDDGSIRLYHSNLKMVKAVKGKSGTKPSCVCFSPDNSKLAVSYSDKAAIDVYAVVDLAYLYSPGTTNIEASFLSSLVWSADGRFMYAATPAAQNNETAIYKWRSGGAGGRSHLSTVGKDSRIAPVLGGGLLYTDSDKGIGLLDKRYGTVYNELGNVWVALEHKYGSVTYEIGGDFRDSQGASGSYWFPISRLKWPINALMAEIGGEIHLGKRFELKGSFSHNITSNLSGKMEDSDWLYDPAIYGDSPDVYSESKTDFKGYVADGAARFWILDRHYSNHSSFALGIGVGFTYQNYDWEARDGYQASWISGYNVGSMPGLVCTYNAQLFMPYVEVALKSKVRNIDIAGSLGFSPYLIAKDEDDHKLRYKLMQTTAHGYAIKGNIQADYNFTANWFVGLRFNLLYYFAKGTQKGYQYADITEGGHLYAAGYQWEIEHEIKSFQLDSMLLAGFRF